MHRWRLAIAGLTIMASESSAQTPTKETSTVKVIRGSTNPGWVEDSTSTIWRDAPGLRRVAVDSGEVAETVAVQADTAWVTVWARKQRADAIVRIQEERRLERRNGQWVRVQRTPWMPGTPEDTLSRLAAPDSTSQVREIRIVGDTAWVQGATRAAPGGTAGVIADWEKRFERRKASGPSSRLKKEPSTSRLGERRRSTLSPKPGQRARRDPSESQLFSA
jgi:hypothetical protein